MAFVNLVFLVSYISQLSQGSFTLALSAYHEPVLVIQQVSTVTSHFVCFSNPSLQSEDVATIADTEELINFDSLTKFMVCVYSGFALLCLG